MTGPTTSGFESLASLRPVKLNSKLCAYQENGHHYIELQFKNTSCYLVFFTQLQLLDGVGKPIRPSFYSDNFFSLLPGESKIIVIDTSTNDMPLNALLVIKGWNVIKKQYRIKFNPIFKE